MAKLAEKEDINHIKAEGELVRSTIEELKSVLMDSVRQRKNISLDLSRVTRIDSAGLGILVLAYRKIIDVGGLFQVVNPTKDVQRLLELTKLDKKFNIIYE